MEPIDYTLGVLLLLVFTSAVTLCAGLAKTGYAAGMAAFTVGGGVSLSVSTFIGVLVCVAGFVVCGVAFARQLGGAR